MKPLATLNPGQVLGGGIYPSLKADAPPFWIDGKNVIFDNGSVRKSKGLTGLANVPARPTGIRATLADGETRAFVGAGDKAYRYRSSDGLTEIGSFATSGGIYQFVPWDTWALISNGSDPLEVWQNAGASAPITAPFNRANTIFGYLTQAFAGGTSNGGQYVEWSPVNGILDWTQTVTGTAGQLRLRELSGDIVAAKPLGNGIGIYGQANAGVFQFTGSSNIYGFRKPINGVGAISPYSVVVFGDKHYGIKRDSAFVTDLVGFARIDEPAVNEYIQQMTDWDRMTQVYGWPDWYNQMVRWSLPLEGGGAYGLGYRPSTNAWTRFEDDVIGGEEAGQFADMLMIKTDRLLRQDYNSADNDGVAWAAYVQSKPLDLGNANQWKHISRVNLKATWTGDVRLQVGYSEGINDTPAWVYDGAMATDLYPDQELTQSEAVYVHLRISSEAAGADWRLTGGTIYGDYRGFVN